MVTETGVRVRRRRRWRHTWQLLHNEMLSSLFTPPNCFTRIHKFIKLLQHPPEQKIAWKALQINKKSFQTTFGAPEAVFSP